jgi:hypothetical protein
MKGNGTEEGLRKGFGVGGGVEINVLQCSDSARAGASSDCASC